METGAGFSFVSEVHAFGFASIYFDPPFVTPNLRECSTYFEDSSHFQPVKLGHLQIAMMRL